MVPHGSPGEDAGRRAAVFAIAAIVLLTALVVIVIGPATRWFRLRSPVEQPAEMQQAVHARFANGIELIGFDLAERAPRQGDSVSVRLYWRALAPQPADVRPFVHLDAITGDMTWANQTKVHAGNKPSSDWPLGFYVVDDYRLPLPADAPPFPAVLRAGLLDDRGELVPLVEGGDQATLAEIQIRERRPLKPGSLPGGERSYRLGETVRLVGHSVSVTATQAAGQRGAPALEITLYWQATGRVPADYSVFVHVLDDRGERIAQGDGPPAAGRYPSSAWQTGQIVVDTRRIALPGDASLAGLRVAVGLYAPGDGARLPATDAQGMRVPDDQIVLAPSAR
jgi:hypothetical protein